MDEGLGAGSANERPTQRRTDSSKQSVAEPGPLCFVSCCGVVEVDGGADDEPDVRGHQPKRRSIRSRTLFQLSNSAVPSSTLCARRLISSSHRMRASSGSSASPSSRLSSNTAANSARWGTGNRNASRSSACVSADLRRCYIEFEPSGRRTGAPTPPPSGVKHRPSRALTRANAVSGACLQSRVHEFDSHRRLQPLSGITLLRGSSRLWLV